MATVVTNKRILITGGTGSFGSLFTQKLLSKNPQEIIIFSRDEEKQRSLRAQLNNSKLRFVLGDIRDFRSLNEAFRGIDIVVHAAALKQIPEVEHNVWEGVKTNVIGLQNIIEAARNQRVDKVVALSTDKAVFPINAYGMTKALAERMISTANLYSNGTPTTFVSVRYGNVLGSRGSVVPIFSQLIQQGQPLTLTSRDMTRFMFTLDQSVNLVIYALNQGVGGETFASVMPSFTIGDLADVMLSQLPKNQRKTQITGRRPGEKIHEGIITAFEGERTIKQGSHLIILPQITINKTKGKYQSKKRLGSKEITSQTATRLTQTKLKKILSKEGWL